MRILSILIRKTICFASNYVRTFLQILFLILNTVSIFVFVQMDGQIVCVLCLSDKLINIKYNGNVAVRIRLHALICMYWRMLLFLEEQIS
jgi:hypothetical protein